MAEHNERVRPNTAASGIAEKERESTLLFKNIVQRLSGFTEEQGVEHREIIEVDALLIASGETVRNQALARMSPSSDMQGVSQLAPITSRCWAHEESEDDQDDIVHMDIASTNAVQMRRVDIEQTRLGLAKQEMQKRQEVAKREYVMKRRYIELEECRLALDERRLNLDVKERWAQVLERTKFMEVLRSIVRMLN